MRYEILEAPGVATLEVMVNEMLENGWKLQGGLCSTKDGTTTYYSQAMVKHEENIEERIARLKKEMDAIMGAL